MNIIEYTNLAEYPVHIEFFEAGGPVASRYKYDTHIKVFSKSDKVYLYYKEAREFLSGKPRLVVTNEKELSLDVYKEFLGELFEQNVLDCNRDFLNAEETKEKVNFFSISLGNAINVSFKYLNSHRDNPEFEPFEDIIQSMKNLLFSNLR